MFLMVVLSLITINRITIEKQKKQTNVDEKRKFCFLTGTNLARKK